MFSFGLSLILCSVMMRIIQNACQTTLSRMPDFLTRCATGPAVWSQRIHGMQGRLSMIKDRTRRKDVKAL